MTSSNPLGFLPYILIYSVHKSRYGRHVKEIQINVLSILSFLAHQHTFSL
uniref:Uncharacterized protein n=1 Tax=Arundo donax TaxID=35708 RepID=A0A0A8Y9D1_ARUDO